MKILYICNDFCGSKVHANLFKRLDELGAEQTIFTYYRGTGKDGNNKFEANHTTFIYRGILKRWHRAFFHFKIRRVYSELIKTTNPLDYDLVYATTLFSDGAIAYKLYKDYGTPYVVAVRSTDTDVFFKYAPHTWAMGLKILKNAQRIFFISPVLKEKLCGHSVVKSILSDILCKFFVQPNGIDDYWIQHVSHQICRSYQILYIGDFLPRKNVCSLIEAVNQVREIKGFKNTKLVIIGGGNDKNGKTEQCICEYKEFVEYHGIITNKDKLRSVMSCCSLFAMPSIHETFGLVYLEALSQNLPILYSLGDGIDGLFDETVGVGVHPKSIDDICNAIIEILTHPGKYGNTHVNFELYDWDIIAKKYMEEFSKI